MIKVSRIAHIELETPDLERQLDYYQRVFGLALVAKDASSAYLATKLGELAVVLKSAEKARCVKLAFCAPDLDFEKAVAGLSGEGIAAETRVSPLPGIEKTLNFTDPNGTEIEVFAAHRFLEVAPVMGIAPFKFGHVAFVVDDPVQMSGFYERVLGFRVSDWVDQYFVFMRCGADHHTVNFLKAEGRRMHHFAFEMRDAAHLIESCETLAQDKLEIIWGPVRHGPGHNMATYHKNFDGLIVELYTELDKMSDERLGYYDPKPWHEDKPQYPKTWPGKARRDVWGPAIPQNFLLQGY